MSATTTTATKTSVDIEALSKKKAEEISFADLVR
jgi:ATP-dependent RNA helicase DDX47/RRP3